MARIAGQASLAEGVLLDWVVEQPPALPQLPVEWLSREQVASELQRVVAQEAQLAAYKAELVLGIADLSPEGEDRPPGSRGARSSWGADEPMPGVSEFFPAELSMVLNCGRGTAAKLIARACTYRANLPGTLAALGAGVLDEPRAKVLAEVCEHAAPEVARLVEGELLEEAPELSLRRLRSRAQALLAEHDADGADIRREEAEKAADVRVYPAPREGMSTVAVDLPAEEAAAVYDMANRLAGMLKADGDDRPIGQLRTRVVADLVLRPWDTSRPSVTAQLQVWAALSALAGQSAQAGEVNGQAITAGHVRELLRQLDALGVQPPAGGSVTVGVADDDGALLATATLDQLRRLARRGCPAHPVTGTAPARPGAAPGAGAAPAPAPVPGAVAGGCSCPVLAPPAAVDRYTPGAAQDRFVRTRDRTCRFPNCGQRVGWADLDHVIPHACGGETDCANLCCLCRSHHRLKTFARHWRFQMSDDGVLTVTTPSGVTRTTRPPRMRPPPEPSEPPGGGGDRTGEASAPAEPAEPVGAQSAPTAGPEPGNPDSGAVRPPIGSHGLDIRALIRQASPEPRPQDPDDPDPPPF